MAERRLGRDREFAADKAGASVTDPRVMAAALVKVHAYSDVWDELQQAAAEAMKEGRMFVNLSQTYAEMIAGGATPAVFDGIADRHLSHPTDSHPPLSARLESLRVGLASVADQALVVAPPHTAAGLVENIEKLEQEISDAYQLLLARQLGIDLTAGTERAKSSPASAIARCRQCGMKVLPLADERCPSCGTAMEDAGRTV